MADLTQAVLALGLETRPAQAAARQLASTLQELITATKTAATGQDRLEKSITGIGRVAQRVRARIGQLVGGYAGLRGIRAVAASNIAFERSMAALRGVAIKTTDSLAMQEAQFRSLGEQAREMGATTRFSAGEAAQGQLFLARAGFQVNEIIGALPATMNLAAVGQLELGRAADIASNIMTAFGIAADDTVRIVDALTFAASNSNTTIEGMGQAMKFAGPAAAALGVSVEEAAAAVGVLASAGLGDLAGRNIRGILAALSSDTPEVRSALGELGLTIDDVDVKVRGLGVVLQELADANLDVRKATALFGRENFSAVLALANGIPLYQQLAEGVGRVGLAAKQAEIQTNTLDGSLRNLQSATEAVSLAVGDGGVRGKVREMINGLADAIRWLGGTGVAFSDLDGYAKGAAASIALVAGAMLGLVGSKILGGLKALAVGVAAISGPFGLALAPIVAATAALVDFNNAAEQTAKIPGSTGSLLGDFLQGRGIYDPSRTPQGQRDQRLSLGFTGDLRTFGLRGARSSLINRAGREGVGRNLDTLRELRSLIKAQQREFPGQFGATVGEAARLRDLSRQVLVGPAPPTQLATDPGVPTFVENLEDALRQVERASEQARDDLDSVAQAVGKVNDESSALNPEGVASFKEFADNLRFETFLLGLSDDERERAIALREAENLLIRAGVKERIPLLSAIDDELKGQQAIRNATEETNQSRLAAGAGIRDIVFSEDLLGSAAQSAGQRASSAFANMATSADGARDSVSRLAEELSRLALQRFLFDQVFGALAGLVPSGAGGVDSTLFGGQQGPPRAGFSVPGSSQSRVSGGGGGGGTSRVVITQNFNVRDYDSFRRSKHQLRADEKRGRR